MPIEDFGTADAMGNRYVTSKQKMGLMTRMVADWARRGIRLPHYRHLPFEIHPLPGADPIFVARVQSALKDLDLTTTDVLSAEELLTLRAVRYHGLRKIGRELFSMYPQMNDAELHKMCYSLLFHMGTLVGEILLRLLGDEVPSWLPWHYAWTDYSVIRPRETFILRPASLVPVQTNIRGVAWGSPACPTASIGRRTAPLIFAPHAVKRIAQRLRVTDQPEYDGWGNIFSYVQRSKYFEPARLYPDDPAISLFDIAPPGWVWKDVGDALLRPLAHDTRRHPRVFRVGYCPVVFDAGWFVATTFLPPGFKGTPEYGKVLALPESPEKDRLLDACNSISLKKNAAPGTQELQVWFHRHGVPQAIRPTREIFEPFPEGLNGEPGQDLP